MLIDAIFDWARRTPGKTAVIYNGNAISYAMFAELIAAARGFFLRRGVVGPGYAAVAVRNLMDFWTLSLALRSLGLSTLSVWSEKTMSNMNLDFRCVVAREGEPWPELEGFCSERGWPLLFASLEGEAPLWFDGSQPRHKAGGHILLTSGTTGIHKMILMTPEHDVASFRRRAALSGDMQDSVCCVFEYPPWTGVGYKRPATAWFMGSAALLEQGREPHRALLHPGITHAVCTPVKLDAILAAPDKAFPHNDALELQVGGGPLTYVQAERARSRITSRLVSHFSATEVDAICFTPMVTLEDHRWLQIAPDRLVQIVDEQDRVVSPGQTGRLRVCLAGGPTGYLNNEAATRQFFRNGFFYTGDLGAIRADGRLALHGRVTDVLNVQGDKIAPAPIENRIREALGVTGVCLFSLPGESGEEELHVVIEAAGPVASEKLKAILVQELPGYARVTVRRVAALPRNAMGKILRREVRALALKEDGTPPV